MGHFNDNIGSPQDLLWDLRQTYIEILSEILKNIANARKENNFMAWFELLDDQLYMEAYQKLTPKEIDEYEALKVEVINVFNKYPLAYRNKQAKVDERYKIKQALKKMEKWLRRKMEEHRMFGGKRR